ncbi:MULTISPECIES: hypothetical protein [Allobranchiibius]|uniref:Peptidase inhibitor family I36 n=1 Tax=Allobranchiibius huperziae TaxID=1874116 RepID=A0A853D9C8_9MICO|nr:MULTISPECIES: hypothetical protein [Allobranchiibius]MBO1765574.1 hypothetical protein [Allobranchiibius sp. GilTou38]NYJ74076.1 hypothetical protein [Allobranchiibius huperziae]
MYKRIAAVSALGLGALGFAGVAPAHAAGSTVHGCAYGYVCIYPQNAGWNGDHPSLRYYHYGTDNLSNQVGYHYVLNNQYNAGLAFCTGYNGKSCNSGLGNWGESHAKGASWNNVYLTPINSIELGPYGP